MVFVCFCGLGSIALFVCGIVFLAKSATDTRNNDITAYNAAVDRWIGTNNASDSPYFDFARYSFDAQLMAPISFAQPLVELPLVAEPNPLQDGGDEDDKQPIKTYPSAVYAGTLGYYSLSGSGCSFEPGFFSSGYRCPTDNIIVRLSIASKLVNRTITSAPVAMPTLAPVAGAPTELPTFAPTAETAFPTVAFTEAPSAAPTSPTVGTPAPSAAPTTGVPTTATPTVVGAMVYDIPTRLFSRTTVSSFGRTHCLSNGYYWSYSSSSSSSSSDGTCYQYRRATQICIRLDDALHPLYGAGGYGCGQTDDFNPASGYTGISSGAADMQRLDIQIRSDMDPRVQFFGIVGTGSSLDFGPSQKEHALIGVATLTPGAILIALMICLCLCCTNKCDCCLDRIKDACCNDDSAPRSAYVSNQPVIISDISAPMPMPQPVATEMTASPSSSPYATNYAAPTFYASNPEVNTFGTTSDVTVESSPAVSTDFPVAINDDAPPAYNVAMQ